jgi:hypothetical protein
VQKPPSFDQRRYRRFELFASVELRVGDETLILPARNVSQGGIFLASDGNDLTSLEAGSAVEVYLFDVTDESRPSVRGVATVVRTTGEGVALAWKLDEKLERALRVLIEAIQAT